MSESCERNRRVLLVGRDIFQLSELRELLNSPTTECESVVNIKTAKQILDCRAMDVMVIDSKLKPWAGDYKGAFVKNLKNSYANTGIVVFNGVRNRTIQRRIRRSGADGYLSDNNNMKNVAESVIRVLGL